VKKPSKAMKKAAGRAAQARAPSRGPNARAARPRATRPIPVPTPVAALPLSLPNPPTATESVPAAVFSRDDRLSVALLLVPVMILTLAVGAVQSLAPSDSARRQLALLPAATAVAATAPVATVPAKEVALADTLTPVPERPKPVASIAATPVRTIAVPDSAGLIPTDMQLRELPPEDAVVAKIASLGHPDKCVATPRSGKLTPVSAAVAPTPEEFGRMLASAARRETEDLIVYTDQYRDLDFPMGDVPALYGVCTDVVIRAYRALGIDLQVLVHNAKLGTGDPSIDHRRVETLRRFFAKYGTSVPVTSFVEEFQPGDIVTYRRPEGRGSQSHIAVVSDVIAPSGRPMIVHNRGWGPQLEDALFANGMTGHYRFATTAPAEQTVSRPAAPPAAHHAAQTRWPDADRLKVNTADAR
jgi:uncharacterized protein YijF (DUF1287 family)